MYLSLSLFPLCTVPKLLSHELSLPLPFLPSFLVYTARMPQFSNPGGYIKVFVNKKDHLTHFLEHMIKVYTNVTFKHTDAHYVVCVCVCNLCVYVDRE